MRIDTLVVFEFDFFFALFPRCFAYSQKASSSKSKKPTGLRTNPYKVETKKFDETKTKKN